MSQTFEVYSEAKKVLKWYRLLANFHNPHKTPWTYFCKFSISFGLFAFYLISILNLIFFCKIFESLATEGEMMLSIIAAVPSTHRFYLLIFYYPDFVSVVEECSSVFQHFSLDKKKSNIVKIRAQHQERSSTTLRYIFSATLVSIIFDGWTNPDTQTLYRLAKYLPNNFDIIFRVLATYWTCCTTAVFWPVTALYVSTMTSVCTLLDLLAYDIELLSLIPSNKLETKLYYYVDIHRKIISIARKLEKLFQYLVIFEFFHFSASVCMSIFSVTATEKLDIVNSGRCLLIGVCVSGLFYMLCSPGEQLKRKSSRIQQSLFYSNWYERPLKIQKKYYMFHMQAIEMTLLKHRIIPIDMESFRQSIRSAYAFFSFCNAANSRS